MSKRAVILAGGKGTRLAPYTVSLPKPLVPIGTMPIAEILIRQLKNQGFDHITLAVNHQADILKAYFGNGSKWDVNIDYSLEVEARGTMGPLSLIADLPDNFLILNGDVFTDFNFESFLNKHIESSCVFSIASSSHKIQVEFGVLKTNEQGYLGSIEEKPTLGFQVSMGVYAASKKILSSIPPSSIFGFDNLMAKLLAQKQNINVVNFDGFWLDIGRPVDYAKATELVESKDINFFPFSE